MRIFRRLARRPARGAGDEDIAANDVHSSPARRARGAAGAIARGAAVIALGACGDGDDTRRTASDAAVDAALACDTPLEPIPPEFAPRCAPTTRACLEACVTADCEDRCFSTDGTPPVADGGGEPIDCAACVSYQQFFCLDSSGCAAEVRAYACCATESCATSEASDCIAEACASELSALRSCATGTASTCLTYASSAVALCFP